MTTAKPLALRRYLDGVTRLDRLARSTRDLLNVIAAIAERGAGFKSLKDAWADTTTPHGKLMVTVLGGLAEFERELIRVRTGEGRKRAKERGVRFGRPQKLTPHQRQQVLQRLAQGETQSDIARSYNLSARGERHRGTHRRPRLSSHPPPSVGVPSRANGSPPASSFESTGPNGFLTSAKMSHTPKGVIRPVTLVQVPNALSRQ